MRTIVPLYIHPLEDPESWGRVPRLAASDLDPVTVVVNVHDGPGAVPEAAYVEATERLHAAGVPMLGYVDLRYQRRSRAEIYRDVAAWQRYPVQGIFFDQAPSGVDRLSEVTRVVRAVSGRVVLNPGTRPHLAYVALAELICTYEGPWREYRQLGDEPDWPNAAHLVYGVPIEEQDAARELVARRAGSGLVTELDLPLPYYGLPSRCSTPEIMRR